MIKNFNELDFISGEILLIDKPLDWTSFDVVNKIRSRLGYKLNVKKLKVGHAGTLDPKATGLVIVCTGKKTKTIDLIQATEKEYIATLKLGATTPSFDLETEEDSTSSADNITLDEINESLNTFLGETDQVPPVFSAIKVNGKRAFSYARKGKELELESRKITISEIKVLEFQLPYLVLKINCSKGTYIRAIARDLGEKLGCGAYLTGLRRTKIGDYNVEYAMTIEIFEENISLM
jgi:tRNA pseudouridine55 synthase